MSRRDCIFAHTPVRYEGYYPPFVNLTVEDGRLLLLTRAPQAGEDAAGVPQCGAFAEVELDPDVVDTLVSALQRWRAG